MALSLFSLTVLLVSAGPALSAPSADRLVGGPQGVAGLTGVCTIVTTTADSGPGSLREAINCANAAPGTDTITFNIPGGGVKTISPVTSLPTITDPVIIDGYTQPGATANTLAVGNDANLLIVLSGASAPSGTNGLTVNTDNTTIRGLVINAFRTTTAPNTNGISILAGADQNVIAGNFIGTNATGTSAVPNGTGVTILNASDNLIGGTAPAARNVLSGNTGGGIIIIGEAALRSLIRGNYIGTNAAGTAAIANNSGVAIGDGAIDSTVGGNSAAARNIISGNSYVGVSIFDTVGDAGAAGPYNGSGQLYRAKCRWDRRHR